MKMKKLILFLYLLTLVSFSLFAQELKEKKEDLDFMFRAEYHVLKSDKKIKQGMYTIFSKWSKKVAVRGNYDHNHLSGTWMFFDYKGETEQLYDFTNSRLIFNHPKIDSSLIAYKFSVESNINDTIKAPIKIGGTYYGLSFVIEPDHRISSYMLDHGFEKSKIKHYLNIDKNGYLIGWKSVLEADDKEFDQNLNSVSEFFKLFIPAKINGSNISSTIIYTTSISVSKEVHTTIIH